ncbi:hypothetical protein DUI87_16192 [Hirundo rustica rustica]|uniref:Uncharacterized protein n=1 Tax=Hirundo rustica rustica TaxID=333673 RepID=A0A3M0K0T6_HIRRU|nr:hypothetical protein DUI87_16192 [Hirundo rustica rustica]
MDRSRASSPAQKDLRLLVDERLDMIQQCVLSAKKDTYVLECIKSSMGSRAKEVTLVVHFALVRPHLEHCIQLWGPQHRKDINLLEQVQRRDTKMIEGMDHFSYEERLREL